MVVKRVIALVAGMGLLGALVFGVLASVGHATAAPVTQPVPPPQTAGAITWANGQITAVQSDGFTLKDRNGQATTVTVAANTWFVVTKNNVATQGALSDLKVGDNVSVAGVSSGANAVAARVVQANGALPFLGKQGPRNHGGGFFGGRGGPGENGMQGTIQSVANGTLTVALGQVNNTRTLTVNTDAGTVVIKNGPAAVADLKAGDTVQITPQFVARVPGATKPATPTLTAAVIYVPGSNDTLTTGQVQTVSGNTLTLGGFRKSNGTQVIVDAKTTYKVLGAAGAAPTTGSLSDVKAGTRVLIYSAKPAAGQTAVANVVLISPAVQEPPEQQEQQTPGGSGI